MYTPLPMLDTHRRLCAPPCGLSTGLFPGISSSNPYPYPSAYPNLWQWTIGGVGITLTDGFVSGWADQSSSGHNDFLSSEVVTHGLSSVTSGGFAAVQAAITGVTGGVQYIPTIASPAYSVFANHSLFCVVQPLISGSSQTYGRILEHSYQNSFYLGSDVTGDQYQYIVNDPSIGTNVGGSLTTGAMTLLSAIYSSSTGVATLRVNGVTVATEGFTAPSSSSTSPVYKLTYQNAPGISGLQANLFEAAIYTDAKSGSVLTAIEAYFGSKYGITL